MASVDITDNTAQFRDAAERAMARALELIGGKAETYAKQEITNVGAVDTGALRNSITHAVEGESVTVGSNMEYSPYIELGTGKDYSPPPEWMEAHGKRGKGRDKWFYQDAQGNWHIGYPQKPRHFLRPAVENHLDEYKNIIENEMKKG